MAGLSPGYDLERLRAQEFPWAGETIYLNHASVGPLPERTRLALEAFNRKRAAPHQLPDRDLMTTLSDSRSLAAELVGAAPEEIALSINTGFGLSLAARALPLQPGDIVLASDREFPANVYPWMMLKDQGVTLELAPTTAEGWPTSTTSCSGSRILGSASWLYPWCNSATATPLT